MLGCRDCNAGSRAVGTAEGGPICSCGRDLTCFAVPSTTFAAVLPT